jgi:lipoprotein-anchoring transpeptidase ErfK/SrfK
VTIDRRGRAWLRVRLPGRANGGNQPPPTGWIRASHTQLSITPWHIVVQLGARQVIVYRGGRLLHTYPAIVGKPSTPTPTGEYFVEETVQMLPGQAGGPVALASSDRSNVLQQFDGGPGQIALHGLDNLGGQLGTAESHGCIRLADSDITWLATRVGPGTPITISN